MEIPTAIIVELVVEEVINLLKPTKCCLWSKRKYDKLLKKFKRGESERQIRIQDVIEKISKEKKIEISDI